MYHARSKYHPRLAKYTSFSKGRKKSASPHAEACIFYLIRPSGSPKSCISIRSFNPPHSGWGIRIAAIITKKGATSVWTTGRRTTPDNPATGCGQPFPPFHHCPKTSSRCLKQANSLNRKRCQDLGIRHVAASGEFSPITQTSSKVVKPLKKLRARDAVH